jgi:hypothetical protein
MATCITTNIATHFLKYLYKLINILFRNPVKEDIKTIQDNAERKRRYALFNAEIRGLKSDLIEDKIETSDPKYHQWIRETRPFLYPAKLLKNLAYDVKANRKNYIKYSYYINTKIERLGGRPYHFIPQRNNCVPKYITIPTNAMIEIIYDIDLTKFEQKKAFMMSKSKLFAEIV